MDWETVRAALKSPPPSKGSSPTAAVAVILTQDLEVLLIRRADHPLDRWSGHMALPGGRVEPEDADLAATAKRETLEETGIDLSEAESLGELDDLVPRSPALPSVIVRPFVFGLGRKPKIRPSAEVAGHLWLGLEELKSSAGTTEVKIQGKTVRVEAFLTGTPPVWGMTQRIIAGFLSRLV